MEYSLLLCERKAKSQPSSTRRRIAGKSLRHNLSHTAQPPGASVSAVRALSKMENKINGSMSTTTSIADSTDTSVSDLTEAGYSNTKLSNESQTLTIMPSSVRNFGNAGTVIHGQNSSGDGTVFNCNILDGSLSAKHFYDRGGDFQKCDSVLWEDFVSLQGANVASSASLPGASLSLSSTTGACKFIKDEEEPSVIMEPPYHNFDPSSDIPALDTCRDAERKQQLGLSDGESTSVTPVSGPRSGLEGSPNFLIDLNQSEQLPVLNQVRTDSRCGLSGKAVIHFDANRHVAPQLMYKNEVQRWQMQTSAEPQHWCQSAGLTEDPFTHGGYDGIQSQALSQRNASSFSAFPG